MSYEVEGLVDKGDGEFTYKWLPKQRKAIKEAQKKSNDIVAITGGNRSGKTITGARWLIQNAVSYDNTEHLALGLNRKSAKKSTYNVLFEQLPPSNINTSTNGRGPEASPIVKNYHKTNNKLVFQNNSAIYLESSEEYKTIEGVEASCIWLDEFAQDEFAGTDSHYEALDTLETRLSAKKGPKTIVITSTGDGHNDAQKLIEMQQDRHGNPTNQEIVWVRMDTMENKFLDDEFKERIKRKYKEGSQMYKQRVKGLFASPQGLVYSNFDKDKHIKQLKYEQNKYKSIIAGYDYGWSAYTAVPIVGITSEDEYHVLDLFYRQKGEIEHVKDWLEEKPYSIDYIYCDSAHPRDIKKLKEEGFNACKADKNIKSGIKAVKEKIRENRLYIDKNNCSDLLDEIKGYKRKDVGSSRDVKDHALDALRYAIYTLEEKGILNQRDSFNLPSNNRGGNKWT